VISGKRCEIGCKLLLFTDRKSHSPRALDRYQHQWPWMTVNAIMTADRRYLCGSWASCHRYDDPRHQWHQLKLELQGNRSRRLLQSNCVWHVKNAQPHKTRQTLSWRLSESAAMVIAEHSACDCAILSATSRLLYRLSHRLAMSVRLSDSQH